MLHPIVRRRLILVIIGILLMTLPLAIFPSTVVAQSTTRQSSTKLPPVVLFPAFHFTKLLVTVHNQAAATDCPHSGSFQDWYLNNIPSKTFSQVCRDKLLTMRFDVDSEKPMSQRFSNQPGVTVQIIDYGMTQSAPFYETLYKTLEQAGYVRNVNIRVAGYDARLTPDMGGFLERTTKLIEDTYRANGNRRVYLVAHSNGPLYAQYFLTHTTRAWKDKYIQGFTPIAGNFPGQGLLYGLLFTGLNITDFSFPATKENAASSARMYLSLPSTYMSAADPRIFGGREIVVSDASTHRTYTPKDYRRLFKDARLPQAEKIANYYIGFVKFTDPEHFPYVDVYAEKGSGISTVVGIELHDLSVGQVVNASTKMFTRDGDVNQEDITNNAVLAWRAMSCFHFSLTNNPGIDHFSLPSNASLLARLVSNLGRPRSNCR